MVARPVAVMIAAALGLGMLGRAAGAAGVALGEIDAAAQHHDPGRGRDVGGIGFRSRH